MFEEVARKGKKTLKRRMGLYKSCLSFSTEIRRYIIPINFKRSEVEEHRSREEILLIFSFCMQPSLKMPAKGDTIR